MARRYYVATWYSGQPAHAIDPADEYALTVADRHAITATLPGCPITFEHEGIAAALAVSGGERAELYRALASVSREDGMEHAGALGVVTHAWMAEDGSGVCAFTLVSEAAALLIRNGHLPSVSLTHQREVPPVPVEVTLCSVPARAGAHIWPCTVPEGVSPETVSLYKAMRWSRGNPFEFDRRRRIAMSTAEVATPVAPMDTVSASKDANVDVLTEAWAAMPEGPRGLLAAHIDKMRKSCEASATKAAAATSEAKKLREELVLATANKKSDMALLERQLSILAAQMPDDVREQYALNDIPSTMADFRSGNHHSAIDAALRTVLCASRTLQLRGTGRMGVTAEPAAKMARTAEPEPTAVAVAPVVAAVAPTEPAGGMEMASETPAPVESAEDVLRKALDMTFA